jgi:Sulfotransferase domain
MISTIGRLPGFIAVGPPRTGTTWLHGILYRCACLPEQTKETYFFDKFYAKRLDWYRAYFEHCADARPIGEVAPTYFPYPQVRERIAYDLPGCKIICTFRDPVRRAYSWYRLMHREGRVRVDFEEAVLHGDDPELREANRYAFHLAEWMRACGEKNVGVFFYDDLVADTQSFADAVLNFLGIPRLEITPDVASYLIKNEANEDSRNHAVAYAAWRFMMWLKSHRAERAVNRLREIGFWRACFEGGPRFEPLAADVEARLRDFFLPEIEALEKMVGRDLSSWKMAASAPAPVRAST